MSQGKRLSGLLNTKELFVRTSREMINLIIDLLILWFFFFIIEGVYRMIHM